MVFFAIPLPLLLLLSVSHRTSGDVLWPPAVPSSLANGPHTARCWDPALGFSSWHLPSCPSLSHQVTQHKCLLTVRRFGLWGLDRGDRGAISHRGLFSMSIRRGESGWPLHWFPTCLAVALEVVFNMVVAVSLISSPEQQRKPSRPGAESASQGQKRASVWLYGFLASLYACEAGVRLPSHVFSNQGNGFPWLCYVTEQDLKACPLSPKA